MEQLEIVPDRELKEILEYNHQPNSGKIFGGRGKMIDRIADAMVFGVLPRCDLCKNGDLYFSHGEYKCVGSMDEFAKCENKVSTITRTPFKVPDNFAKSYDFLGKFRFKERDRATDVIAATNPNAAAAAAVATSNALKEQEATSEVDQAAPAVSKRSRDATDVPSTVALRPFQGMAVMFVGKLTKKQADLENIVTQHGGVIAKSVGAASVCVCTPVEATGNGTQKGKDAVAKGILCLSEKWLEDSVEAGHRLPSDGLAPYVLANPKTQDAARTERATVAQKLEIEFEAKAQRALLEEKYSEAPKSKKGQPEVKRIVVKGNSAVEPDSGLAETGHIYVAKGGDAYNSIMNLTDVTTGKNSFYILQLIEHDDTKISKYTVYRKWGRLGEDGIGGDKKTDYPVLAPAIREFEKTFADKTGNDWSTRKSNFKKMFGKFMPIEIDYSANSNSSVSASSELNTVGYAGKLPKATQDFVSLIFDIKAMTAAMQEMEIDTQKMPLGKLSKDTIREGFTALKELQQIVEKKAEGDPFSPVERTRLVSLTNKFYTYIPHVLPSEGSRGLLDTLELIKQKVELLTQLQDLEIASKVLSGEGAAPAGEHPIDTHYRSLKADMAHLDRSGEEFKRLDQFLQNTHGSTHTSYQLELLDAWSVEREGESARFEPFQHDPNRMLLWHGSRLTNWGGIISQGLRIAPPEAPSTGYMFGKGVYFADMSSKSANYCFTSSDKTAGILMLCEVALGAQYKLKKAEYVDGLKKPFLSTFGMGKNHPNPAEAFHEDNGCVIPLGHGVASGISDTTLLYNEFIVYNVAQVKTRYVLRLNFRYAKKTGTFF